jgi:hypothetical protein
LTRRWILLPLLFALPFIAAHAGAKSMFLQSKKVTVNGIADLGSMSEAEARDAAIKNALRNAIEQVVGVLIESRFSAEQKETIKNKKTDFESKVSDSVYSESAGFIDGYKVVSEKKEGSSYNVTVEALVKAQPLAEELDKLQSLFASAGYPTIMLLLSERYTDKAGQARVIERPSITPAVESVLLERTFELVAKEQADALREQGMQVYTELLGSDDKVAEVAAKHGADVVVVGSSEVKYSAFNELGNNMVYVSTVINLRAVNASTAKILASIEETGKGFGANEELARVKAIRDGAPTVVSKLLDSLVQAWTQQAGQGRRFKVVVMKVRNYRKVARPLMKAMKAVPNVEAVKEVNFGGKRLELEIIFKGSKEELLDGLFDRVANKRKFRKLDKVMDQGENIQLTL